MQINMPASHSAQGLYYISLIPGRSSNLDGAAWSHATEIGSFRVYLHKGFVLAFQLVWIALWNSCLTWRPLPITEFKKLGTGCKNDLKETCLPGCAFVFAFDFNQFSYQPQKLHFKLDGNTKKYAWQWNLDPWPLTMLIIATCSSSEISPAVTLWARSQDIFLA